MPASVGTVWVDVRFNVGDVSRQLQAALANAARTPFAPGGGSDPADQFQRTWTQSFAAVGAEAAKLGRSMSIGLTVPLVALGRSATSSFNEFDKAMTQITALNAVPIEQTEQWRGQVRALGEEYGVAGEEAAKGMYFITSSGVDAADAMGVLETSTKGAAVGLGETKVVADVLTSALSAYGAANQSAAKTGDQLVAAVRYGKGEADELAGALSQVIPIAANVGVSFGEVAGAMSAMTLSGTSADQAATQLRGLFNTLQDMPPIAQKALKEYTGLDYAQVRLKLSSDGLIPTLKRIYDGFGDNKEAMAEVFGNIRALTGVFNLFGQNTERTLQIVNNVTNATGDLNKAWDVTAESKSKKLEVAMTSLHDAMIGLGADVVPALTPVVGVIGKLGGAFGALPEPVRASAVAFGMFAAATGPALFIFGQMAQGVDRIKNAFTTLTSKVPALTTATNALATRWTALDEMFRSTRFGGAGAMGGLTAAVGAWAAALTAVIVAYQKVQEYQADVLRMQEEIVRIGREGVASSGGGVKGAETELAKVNNQLREIDKYGKKWQEGRDSWNPLASFGSFLDTGEAKAAADAADPLLKLREELTRNLDISKKMSEQRGVDQNAAMDWLTTEALAGRTYKTAEDAMNAYNRALANNEPAALKLKESTLVASNSLGGLIAAAKTASDSFFGLQDAEKRRDDAVRGREEAIRKVAEAERAYRDAQQKTVDANQKIIDSQRKAKEASEDLVKARQKLTDAEKAYQDALAGPSADEKLNVQSAQLALRRAQGGNTAALDRQQKQLDIRRARLDLAAARAAHGQRVEETRQAVEDARRGVADAVQAERDAKRGVVDATRDAARAKEDEAQADRNRDAAQRGVADAERELFDATGNLAVKQDEMATAIANSAGAGDKFLAYLDAMKAQYPELAGTIDNYIAKFKELRDAGKPPPEQNLVNVPGKGQYVVIPNVGGAWVDQNAAGGPLGAGQLSTVNERGTPELWSANGKQYLLPTDHGQVTPLKPATIDVKGGDGVSIGDIYVQGADDPVQTAYEVRRQLRIKGRSKGRT